jgi:hypothetical protein
LLATGDCFRGQYICSSCKREGKHGTCARRSKQPLTRRTKVDLKPLGKYDLDQWSRRFSIRIKRPNDERRAWLQDSPLKSINESDVLLEALNLANYAKPVLSQMPRR